MSSSTATSNVITLRGSTDIVTEFFDYTVRAARAHAAQPRSPRLTNARPTPTPFAHTGELHPVPARHLPTRDIQEGEWSCTVPLFTPQ